MFAHAHAMYLPGHRSPEAWAGEAAALSKASRELIPHLLKTILNPSDPVLTQELLSNMSSLCAAAIALLSARDAHLEKMGKKAKRSNRSSFVSTLTELLGLRPDREWETEWQALNIETSLLFARAAGGPIDEATIAARANAFTIEKKLNNFSGMVKWQEERGWYPEHARGYTALTGSNGAALAEALMDRDPKFAASTYVQYEALMAAALRDKEIPPVVYCHLSGGPTSASTRAPQFSHIERPDAYGFCGFTCYSEINLSEDPSMFAENGDYLPRAKFSEGKPIYEVSDSDVIAVISHPLNIHGMHSVVHVAENEWRSPPNSLWKLLAVRQPGEWEVDGKRPQRRLLECSITYLANHGSLTNLRMAAPVSNLVFADRKAYARGLNEITASCTLTMAQEWLRGDIWSARDGRTFVASEEWAYVVGIAGAEPVSSGSLHGKFQLKTFAGLRDDGNEGMSVNSFMERANAYMRTRASTLRLKLGQEAYLTAEEVIAVRLYSGPGFHPLNKWLRNVGRLDADVRTRLAQDPDFTYASTVNNICSALRKLARVGTAELHEGSSLWRGVGGKLPLSFWTADASGMLCFTDLAFTSTSLSSETPKHYMRAGRNVLWHIKASSETEEGFHCGADIGLLSQYPKEREVLFPPLTMFQVEVRDKAAILKNTRLGSVILPSPLPLPSRATIGERGSTVKSETIKITWMQQPYQVKSATVVDGDIVKQYLEIDVVPTFI